MKWEKTTDTDLLSGVALEAVIVVISSRRSEGSRRRVGPSRRIQHEVLRRIDAVAIEILDKQRLSCHPIIVFQTDSKTC